MKFREFELGFDIMNADHAEIYEMAVNAVQTKTSEARYEGETLSDVIRKRCAVIYDFFDTVVGVDFRKQLFHEGDNVATCLKAYIDFTVAIEQETKKVAAMVEEVKSRKAASSSKTNAGDMIVNGKTAWRKA